MPTGDNTIQIGKGANSVYGTAANDTFRFTDVDAAASPNTLGHIDGGAGYDTIDLSNINPGHVLTVKDGAYVSGFSSVNSLGQDPDQLYTFSNVEQILLGPGIDQIDILGSTFVGVAVHGGGGGDKFTGGVGAYLYGDGGDDTFSITEPGSYAIDGGSGTDRVVYQAFSSYYPRSVSQGTITLFQGNAKSTITNVEDVSFYDGHLIIDPNSYDAQIQRIYGTVLYRHADLAGLNFWVHKLDAGTTTLSAIADALLVSPEYQAATGFVPNSRFIYQIYETALSSTPDKIGYDYWMGQLNAGVPRGQIAAYFSETAEHKAFTANIAAQGYFDTNPVFQQVALLYDSAFGRLPDANGETYWANSILTAKYTLQQVADIFAGSERFPDATAHLSNSQLVSYMYEHTLHRNSEALGYAFWVDQVDHGLSKGALLLGFAESGEHANLDIANLGNGIVLGG